MGIFRNLLGAKDTPIKSNEDFWIWFQNNEKNFLKVIKNQGNIERDFFNKLSSKLNQLRDGYWFLAGMCDNNTAELILTADGVYKNIVFVEDLVNSAPKIDNWKFSALKPALDIKDVNISMGDLKFSQENLSFYSNDNSGLPDEIDITITYADYTEDLKEPITNGVYIFMDNYLGELNSVTTIDNMKVIGQVEAEKELIPIEKLKDYLNWRQKEFIEKYEGTRYNTENDSYNSLEATLNNGKPLLAIVNSTLLDWDSKASHPWILTIEIKYKGNENGMPDKETYELMNIFEDNIMLELKDSEGYLSIGRQTADGSREIYFACKDFRLPSKVLTKNQLDYRNRLNIDYDIYKDKYWKSFDRFKPDI
ncbi:hypothetical protein GCM10007049_27450 [Echinicola pacifica]|uniref:DUF695 domain-containing protein n=1 Tax=Echinicola pacifica TaxID=346377 RepID=A0A918Q563_9BACT|nr:DUF695 domain-containing protein [Echinicola pacifica]GGZ32468.1 hypothetical protein GCM10007049_27450 [Echinicola pacifica]